VRPLPRWAFYASAAATGAFALTASGFGLATRGAQADYRRYAASSSAELPVDGAELAARGRAGDSLAAVTTGALIASGAAALATLAMIPWVDWSDR